LELGGSDPFIVFEDADLDKAIDGGVKGRFINCGQSCIAAKRFIVLNEIAEEFVNRFVHKVEELNVGDPLSNDTDLGPLTNKRAQQFIDELVTDAKKKGAEILSGGEKLDRKGFFYKPTVLTNIKKDMRINNEETFGPVAPIYVVDDENEAIKLANDTPYGLGASIWTTNMNRAEIFSHKIKSGLVSINSFVKSDPRIPFGGIKHSGFGRELSIEGLKEFVNVKSIRYYDELIHEHHVE